MSNTEIAPACPAGRRMISPKVVFKKMSVSPATGERRRREDPRFAALFRQVTPGRVAAFEDEVDAYLADLPPAGDASLSATHAGPGRPRKAKSLEPTAAEAATK